MPWSQSMYWWQQVKSQKPAPSPQTSTILQGNQILLYSLDTDHLQFTITPKDRFRYQLMMIQLTWYIQAKNKKIWLKQITLRRFYIKQCNQLKQTSLNSHPEPLPRPSKNLWGKKNCMSCLNTTDIKFSNHTQGQLSVSMNDDFINANKKVNHQWHKYNN